MNTLMLLLWQERKVLRGCHGSALDRKTWLAPGAEIHTDLEPSHFGKKKVISPFLLPFLFT